ncbi:MAG: hypothetical protein ACP5K8_04385 [Nitrososphaeria archaeon]
MKKNLVAAPIKVFGDNLVSVVLLGYYSRGDFSMESDVHVLIMLEEIVEYSVLSMVDSV